MAKEKITGAEALMRSLEHEGVTTLFGYPGGAIMPVYDALYGYKDTNVFAIGLAAKKKYTFICLIPYYIEHDYWHSVVGGIERARQELRPFNVSVNYLCYHHGDKKSYQEACHTIRDSSVDAVLIAPNFREETIE